MLPEAQRSNDIIRNIERYDLWAVPHFPMELPWVRDRTDGTQWRLRMRDDIRDNGLRWPILVFGHSPKGPINKQYITDFNRDRPHDIYVGIGTNRYWCLWDLGWDTFPAIYSLNKGSKPPEEWGEVWKVDPVDFPKYSPDDCYRIWVREHAFGYKPLEWPSVEFGECQTADSAQ